MKVIAAIDFKYSYNGIKVVKYLKGKEIEVDKIHYDKMLENGYIKVEELENKVVEPEESKNKRKKKDEEAV